MGLLHLPADRLRLALAAGVVPADVARRPVPAARDARGVWLLAPADLRAALVRLGAVPRAAADAPPLRDAPCWAVLVSLVPSTDPAAGPLLVPAPARMRHPRGVRFTDGRAWLLADPPHPGPAYSLRAPGVWVRVGWSHPLPDLLAAPAGGELVLDPDGWGVVPATGYGAAMRLELLPAPTPRTRAVTASVPLPLGRGATPAATLWVRPGRPADVVAELIGEIGPDPLGAFAAAPLSGCTLVRIEPPAAPPAVWGLGFASVPGRPGWYCPAGCRVRPLPPAVAGVAWLADGPVLHQAPAAAFRPLTDWRVVEVPPVRQLLGRAWADPLVAAVPRPPAAVAEPMLPPAPPVRAARPNSRLKQSARRVRAAVVPLVRRNVPSASTPSDLRRLEDRLVSDLPDLPPAERAGRWAELATAYDAAGRPADAATCWLNAAWDHPDPPAGWLQRWRGSEAEAASGRPSAVFAARLGAAALVAGDAGAADLVAAREADLPVRAVWLAAVTASARAGGDPLGLARCRDRLLTRLDAGPALHPDAPGFVARVGRVAEPPGRDWLTAAPELVTTWLDRHGPGTKLHAAGLDADRPATRRYAELVIAWGAATAGEPGAGDRAAEAAAVLVARRQTRGADPAVHRLLAGAFLHRVRAALSGHPADPTPGGSDFAAADRYVVERVRAGCESLGGGAPDPFDTPANRLIAAAHAARTRHRSDALRALLATADPGAAEFAAGPLFRAARQLGLADAAAPLVEALAARRPPPGGRRDLGLAVGRYLLGDAAGGDRALDAARGRLLTGGGDPRERGELAVAYAAAVGHATPGVVGGRLDELFRRLGPVSLQGACGRYLALQPLRVVDAAVRAAAGDDFAPSPAVRRFLADEELTTRRRIGRDINQVLGAECRVPGTTDARRRS